MSVRLPSRSRRALESLVNRPEALEAYLEQELDPDTTEMALPHKTLL